jgi:hypothetical protein
MPIAKRAMRQVGFAAGLMKEGADSPTLAHIAGDLPTNTFKARFQAFPDWREEIIEEAGHMVHHDQPERVAALIEEFCA